MIRIRLFLSLSFLLGFANANAGVLQINNTKIPEAPPTAEVMVAYMDFHNNSDKAITIEKIRSPEFEKIELHKTIVENDISKMVHQKNITLAKNSTVSLKPNGLHLMLINPKKPLYQGDTVLLIFTQKDGTEHAIDITVKRRDHQNQHHH